MEGGFHNKFLFVKIYSSVFRYKLQFASFRTEYNNFTGFGRKFLTLSLSISYKLPWVQSTLQHINDAI